MKLFRSDLEQLISNQLFEISTDNLDLGELQVAGNIIMCTISVETAANGYRIYGKLNARLKESCDRCLTNFIEDHESNINVILTNDDTLLNEKNIDIIRFAGSEEFVDLTPFFHDLVLLTEPFKQLCDNDCKGLCSNCGKNLNLTTCACHLSKDDTRWDLLKNI